MPPLCSCAVQSKPLFARAALAVSVERYGAHPLEPIRRAARSGIGWLSLKCTVDDARMGTDDEGVVFARMGMAGGGGIAPCASGVRPCVDETDVERSGWWRMGMPGLDLCAPTEDVLEDRREVDEVSDALDLLLWFKGRVSPCLTRHWPCATSRLCLGVQSCSCASSESAVIGQVTARAAARALTALTVSRPKESHVGAVSGRD